MMLWFNMNQVDKSKPVTWKSVLYLLLFILILYGIIYLKEVNREKLLEEYNTIDAIVTNKSSGYKGSNSIYVEYKLNNEIYKPYGIQLDDCTDKYRIGDSVLIKYSLKDPKIVTIADCDK
ncbi:MAG: hypothetical protein KF704_09645 [Crocinitomicaceae bacterium]|nr:hypothetical protein [Crocinitomicaceae bacterium]NGF74605.1 hypothetical protein [Fluviicola sp. SGL-29]